MNSPTLRVHTPQGESGSVLVSADDYLFRYSDKANAQSAISLSMPVRVDEYRRRDLHPIFQMNLPEGYVLEQLRNRLAKTVKVDPMLLLALSGSSAPIGRVFVCSDQVSELIQRNSPPSSGENLDEILAWDGTEDLFADLVDRYILRAGISGVQPKVLVPEKRQTPEQRVTSKTNDLIIKSGRDEFPGLAINEYLCMSIARDAGIPTPPFYLSQNQKLFIMRRFDRDEQLNPLGFEDMTTLMGLSAEQKYTKSYGAMAKAVRVFCSPAHQRSSLDQLFDSVALSCIVGNGDAHLKNFGVLYNDPVNADTRLAPAYDIVNTTAYIPDDTLALDMVGNKSFFASRLGILEFARTCEVEKPEERIQALLQTLEIVLKREDDYCRLAPDVAKAIRQSSQGYQLSFGG